MTHIRDGNYFKPSTGYFHAREDSGGWEIVGNDGVVGFVPTGPNKEPRQSQCDAMLMAGGPEMLETLVRAHNALNGIADARDPAAIARKIQGSIRGGLAKVVGGGDNVLRIRDHRLIIPVNRDGQ